MALASFLAALSTVGCLTQLTSLDLKPHQDAGALLLSPLGRLAALTSLRFAGCAYAASGRWLPPGLRKLHLAGRSRTWPGIGGASWLDCVGACTGLESLQLLWLEARDLGIKPHLYDGLSVFYDSLKQVRCLLLRCALCAQVACLPLLSLGWHSQCTTAPSPASGVLPACSIIGTCAEQWHILAGPRGCRGLHSA
jgi:hypothetical protein